MGRILIDALEIEVPEGVVDHIDDAGGRRIWERCELRALTGDGEVAAKAGVRRGCVTMVGGKSFKWNQLALYVDNQYTKKLESYTINDGQVDYVVPAGWTRTNGMFTANFADYAESTDKIYVRHEYDVGEVPLRMFRVGSTSTDIFTGTGVYENIVTASSNPRATVRVDPNPTGVSVTCHLKTTIVNLTRAFGAGSEPSTVAAAQTAFKLLGIDITQPQEYDAGSIRSAVPEAVVTRGRNLLNYDRDNREQYIENEPVDRSATNNPYYGLALRNLPAGSYTVYFDFDHEPTSNIYIYCRFKDAAGTTLTTKNLIAGKTSGLGAGVTKTTSTVPEGGSIVIYNAVGTTKATAVSVFGILAYLGVTRDDTGFIPYRAPITRPIPDAVKALAGYGWSAGTAYNRIYREGDRWYYRQEVDRADLGVITSAINTFGGYVRIHTTTLPIKNAGSTAAQQINLVSDRYVSRASPLGANDVNNAIAAYISGDTGRFYFRDDSLESKTVAEIKSILLGSWCYYEIATPVITDITDMMTDFGWEYMVEGDRYEVTEPSGIQVPMEAAYFVRYGTSAWVSTQSLMLEMDQMELTGGEPDNFEEV